MQRHFFSVLSLTCASLLCSAAEEIVEAGTLQEFIELRGSFARADVFDFVFVDNAGNATTTTASDTDTDGSILVAVPGPALSKAAHTASCAIVVLTNFQPLKITSSAASIPMLEDSTGLSLLPVLKVDEIHQLPAFTVGQSIEVVDGVSTAYPVATIREPGVPFTSIRPEDFADGGVVFPLFTGTATVAELLDVRVFVVPEPATHLALLALGTVLMMNRRQRPDRKN